ncbi:MAG: deoxyuridine 5'-triphosphate nucleotidohydrolase [Solobacterium sp.]|nr:deoxyuridine 5'-triphosphate nucleotidohydrolase [Solobacterium sp.]
MERIAAFEKVSREQFAGALTKIMPEADAETVNSIYDAIVLPARATAGSAGYDFYAPFDVTLAPGEEIRIPTGIRAKMKSGYVLMLFPRSSLGFRYRLQLNNTVGIIDSDYYNAENEGHIFVKMTNDTREGKTVEIRKGQGMVQGIFLPFGITEDDATDQERTGGMGSTDQQKAG